MDRPKLNPSDRLWPGPPVSIDEHVGAVLATRTGGRVLRVERSDPARRLAPTFAGEGAPLTEVISELRAVLDANERRNAHPGMFGYVCAAGLPTDPLAHALTAAYAQNVTSFGSAPGATTIERRLIAWLVELVRLPGTADGHLVSGGSHSNLTALTVALQRVQSPRDGLFGGKRPIVYASTASHFSILRTVRLLGLGTDGLRFVPVDKRGRMDASRLERLIKRDAAADLQPAVICATAGTTLQGAIDPLESIADIANDSDTYLHVDAAYGGAALLSEELRPALAGIERADSVAIDLHKWFFTTYDASAILFRDPGDARRTFFERADYTLTPASDHPRSFGFYHQGWETSRRFRALAPWIAIRHYGPDRLARNVEFNVRCAQWLAERVRDEPWLTLVGEVSLSICTFRAGPPGADDRTTGRVTEAVREGLNESGEFFLSAANIDGRPVLRVCVVSPETSPDTIDALVERCVALARATAEQAGMLGA